MMKKVLAHLHLLEKKQLPVLALLLAMKLVTSGNRLNCTICQGDNTCFKQKKIKHETFQQKC